MLFGGVKLLKSRFLVFFRRAALLLACFFLFPASSPAAGMDDCGLRGWQPENGYQYVILGFYPYEADGTRAPVLWQVLDVEDGQALLYTTYVIEVHQPLEVSGQKAEKHSYPDISDYAETDLNTWLNEVMIQELLADEPVLAAVTAGRYGRLYPLTDEELMTEKYGFTYQRFYEVRSRWAYATPYALNVKLYPNYGSKLQKDHTYGTVSYWVAALKRNDKTGEQIPGKRMQICAGIADPHGQGGTNIGHLSNGFLNRTTVGLRLALRLDVSKIQVISGNGSIWDPCRLAYVEDKTAADPVVLTPPLRPGPTPVPTTPAPVKGRPELNTPGPDTTPVPVPDWAKNGAD